jgi:alpha-2-macroglobulin
LGLALKAAGDQKRAAEALSLAFGAKWAYPDNRWLGDYGSAIRDHARALSLALDAGVMPGDSATRLLELAYQLRAQSYYSTQESVAILRLARGLAGTDDRLQGSLKIGAMTQAINAKTIFSADLTQADLNLGASLQSLVAPTYLIQQSAGIPKVAPAPTNGPVSIARRYYTLDGKPFAGDSIEEGQQLLVELAISSKEWLPDTMIVDLLPGGLEAENLALLPEDQLTGLKIGEQTVSDIRAQSSLKFEEFRDDRVIMAMALNESQQTRYVYMVRAISPGNYAVPPPAAEDMYRPDRTAIGAAIPARITVTARR